MGVMHVCRVPFGPVCVWFVTPHEHRTLVDPPRVGVEAAEQQVQGKCVTS